MLAKGHLMRFVPYSLVSYTDFEYYTDGVANLFMFIGEM